MTPNQFRADIASLGLTQTRFARLAMVDARTVRRWCGGTRAVPGPVVALLRILMVTDEWRESFKPTHWMPLPAPPKVSHETRLTSQ